MIHHIYESAFKITKAFAMQQVIKPLKEKGFDVKLVGGVKTKGFSTHDMDILFHCNTSKEFVKFEKQLKKMGWNHRFSDEDEDYNVFHNYEKEIGTNSWIGLDVFIDEDDDYEYEEGN